MASGSFKSSTYSGAGTGYRRYVEVKWSSSNISNNRSTISWTAYIRSPDTSTTAWVQAKQIRVTINGSTTTLIGDTATPTTKDQKLGSGTYTVTHNSDGTKSVNVAIGAQFYSYGTDNSTYSGSITMTRNPVYSLSINAGTGSTITVKRTSCAGAATTTSLSNGDGLCKGDVLKITASVSGNYELKTLQVKKTSSGDYSNFTSGNSLTVSGDTSVKSTAQELASQVAATDANIGSVSTITVTKYNSSYYHSLQFSFGSSSPVTGYINANGTVSSSAVRIKQTNIAFTVPDSFYAKIPNDKKGTCTITCRTYKAATGGSQLGSASTCTFVAKASSSVCGPTVNGTVVDTNSTTIALTGNSSKLVKYRSNAQCTITASAPAAYGASLTTKSVNDSVISSGSTKTFSRVAENKFVFKAVDSRGYSATKTVTPTMVNYIELTCNPKIYRPTPTGGSIRMRLSGNYYNGSFGATSNSLTVQYMYRRQNDDGSTYPSWPSSWTTIANSNFTISSGTYTTTTYVQFGTNFNYKKEYQFRIKVSDAANPDGVIAPTITLQSGIPVFDWGKKDMNINVPLNVTEDVTVDGHSINIKQTILVYENVALTDQSGNGAYRNATAIDISDYVSGTVIGVLIQRWTGAAAAFVPYCRNKELRFMSDVSQTIGQVYVLVTSI